MAEYRSSGTFSLRPERGYSAVSYRPARTPKRHDLCRGLGASTVTREQHALGFRSFGAVRKSAARAVRQGTVARAELCTDCFIPAHLCGCGDGHSSAPTVSEHVADDYLLSDI